MSCDKINIPAFLHYYLMNKQNDDETTIHSLFAI